MILIKTADSYVAILVDENGYTKAQLRTAEYDGAVSMFNEVI